MLIDLNDKRGVILSAAETALVDPSFQWKTKNGRFLYPRDMQTSHLFYTFRMLWNNLSRPEFHVGKVRLYTFGTYYRQPGYFHAAILNIGHELSKRHLLQSQLQELQAMKDHLEQLYKLAKQAQNDI